MDGDIRLAGSSVSYEGRVEICINHAWGDVCDEGWDVTDANVACAQLGFQPLGKIKLSHSFCVFFISYSVQFLLSH